MTRALVSRTNDAKREPPRPNPLNRQRAQYILHAFYLEANMHSEVFSLFGALLDRLSQWIDETGSSHGGFSMNSLHEMMTLCRRAASELEVLRDYRRREGVGMQDEPLELVAVLPAIVATLGVPQRTELIRQLVTIAPSHRDQIAQLAEHIRIFSGKPWKEPAKKNFGRTENGPLARVINRIIDEAADNDISCIEKEHVGEVDRIEEGLAAALRAAMFLGQCGNGSPKTVQPIERFAMRASTIHIPRVILEASRPLQSVRFEVFQYASALPHSAQPLLQIVTRAVNEKMELRDIAERLKQAIHPNDMLLAPVVLAPLALVSSLRKVLELADIVLPASPKTFEIIAATMFAAIQSGDDYYKLAEQIDFEQSMYPEPKYGHSATIANNLSAFYSRSDISDLSHVEPEHEKLVSSSLRKGFKALAWDRKVPRKGDPIMDTLAIESRSFKSDDPVSPDKFVVDYWHALSRYILPNRIPFQQPSQSGNMAGLRDRLPVQDYSTMVAIKALNHETLPDRIDQILAYETIKLALHCPTPQCTEPDQDTVPVLIDLLAREIPTDKAVLLKIILDRKDLVEIARHRLKEPNLVDQPSNSFTSIASSLKQIERQESHGTCSLIDEGLTQTRHSSPFAYLRASALLLHDCIIGNLPIRYVHNNLPAASFYTFLHSENQIRDRLLVVYALERSPLSILNVSEMRFVNHLKGIDIIPPPRAIAYVKERLDSHSSFQDAIRHVFIQGDTGRSRFTRKLKRRIVQAAISN